MKKSLLWLISLFLGLSSYAQVGVNTQDPKGIFHIHTGVAGSTDDDIIVTSKGSLGIGTLAPTSHVHIDKGTASSFIRIEDTSEGAGDKFLASDSDGKGSWIPATTLNGKVYRMNSPSGTVTACEYNTNTIVPFNNIKDDSGSLTKNPTPGVLTIQADGTYVFNFRWWGSIKGGSTANDFFTPKAYVRLYKVTVTVSGSVPKIELDKSPVDEILVFDRVSANGTTTPRNTFITSLYGADLKKGDLYVITVAPANNSGITWQMGQNLTTGPDGQCNNIIYFPSVAVYNI